VREMGGFELGDGMEGMRFAGLKGKAIKRVVICARVCTNARKTRRLKRLCCGWLILISH